MTRGGDVGGGRTFAEHLRDGVSGDEVDEQEHEAYYQPDYGQSVEDALEYGFQLAGSLYLCLRCHPELSERECARGVEGSVAARLIHDFVWEFQ